MRRLLYSAAALAAILAVWSCSGNDNGSPDNETDNQTIPASRCSCEPLPEPDGGIITVGTPAELAAAVEQANSSGGEVTILVQTGSYTLTEPLWVTADKVTVRGASGNRADVVIRGQGMNGGIGFIFVVAGKQFTAADMTIGWVANHAVQIQGEQDADAPLLHNIHFVDTYEQMLKVSYEPGSPTGADNGIVECCLFEYSAGMGPQYYIGGVDGHQCTGWIIRGNTFLGIKSPERDLAEYAVHFWSDSEDTLVENNLIIDCDRGIGFGLGDRGHNRGMIRNNMVSTSRDVGIGLENAGGVKVYNNSVHTENYGNSIEYRFPGSTGIEIINNLTSGAITERDGGSATGENNRTGADPAVFADAPAGDLHLAAADPAVVDQGLTLSDITVDFDCENRPQGSGYDIGADEFALEPRADQ